MSTTSIVVITCDSAEGCPNTVRSWHWAGGWAAGSQARRELRERGWLTVKHPEGPFHFCPDHKATTAISRDNRARRIAHVERWLDGLS